jgi:2-polyprenyl-3-methyl-5-hydroxy-6-metoxy-1,4-benzoquinol methylase
MTSEVFSHSRNEYNEAAAFDRLADLREEKDLRTSDWTFSRYRSAVLGQPIYQAYPDRMFLHIGNHHRRGDDPRRPLEGLKVLDLGAGDGLWSVILAEQGAEVTSIEISPRQVEHARTRMELHDLVWDARVGSAYCLEELFPPASFDLIFAQAILHHLTLDLERVYDGMHHLLRPGGHATINEPYCSSPRLRRVRERLSWLIPFDQESPDERPCDDADLRSLSTLFSEVVVERYDLFARLARRVFRSTRMERELFRLDRLLLRGRTFQSLAGSIFIAVRK